MSGMETLTLMDNQLSQGSLGTVETALRLVSLQSLFGLPCRVRRPVRICRAGTGRIFPPKQPAQGTARSAGHWQGRRTCSVACVKMPGGWTECMQCSTLDAAQPHRMCILLELERSECLLRLRMIEEPAMGLCLLRTLGAL